MVRICCVAVALLALQAVRAAAADVEIGNKHLRVRWDEETSRVSVYSTAAKREVLREVRLSGEHGGAQRSVLEGHERGDVQAIEIAYADGGHDSITLVGDEPFALFRSKIANKASEPKVVKDIRPFSGVVDLGAPADQLTTFGTAGLKRADKNPGSYAWLAVVEPKSRRGVVTGWVTHARGSGVLFTDVEDDAVQVDGQIDYGRLMIPARSDASLETLAVGYFDDARLGLEAWADLVAKVHDVHLPPQPAGYCTWYSKPHGGASDEAHLAELAEFAAKELKPYGFSVVQIDDKWQDGVSTNGPRRNFTTHDPKGPYPAGMKAIAEQVTALGLTPGIWFMPFAGTHYDPFFKEHQDWFVKRENGEPYETKWGGTCLDLTNPATREYVRSVAQRICRAWGFRYVKLDGLWTGSATPLRYVNTGYAQDDIGDAVFHDPRVTNIEAYRSGLKLVREAIGPDVFILGCNGPQNMRSYGGAFGLVDAMRVGPDNGAEWNRLIRGPEFGSRHYFMHGRVWYNDPDPVYVRQSMPLEHAQLICSWVALTGQLNLSSEWLPGLPAERIEILKRSMPAHGLLPRPVDLFEHDPPRLWLLSDERRTPRRDVIGVFNWDKKERKIDYSLEQLGLSAEGKYAAFDYWGNELAPPLRGRLSMKVPGESCHILAVRLVADHPQVISTSRHVTQGIVDVASEEWDGDARTLRGVSRVVANDPYELRIVLPEGLASNEAAVKAHAADGATLKADLVAGEGLARVTIDSSASGDVAWSVTFK